jgi:alpha-beta hydrolase superfamily lysophospholipase
MTLWLRLVQINALYFGLNTLKQSLHHDYQRNAAYNEYHQSDFVYLHPQRAQHYADASALLSLARAEQLLQEASAS